MPLAANPVTDTTSIGPGKLPESGIGATLAYEGNFSEITSSKLATIFGTHLNNADSYRKKFVAEWLNAYNQYNGVLSDDFKAEWQARTQIPLAKQAVDVSTARVVSALFENEDFFDILPYQKGDEQKTDIAKKALKWQLWKAKFRAPLTTAIKNAFITGFGPLMITYAEKLVPRTVVQSNTQTISQVMDDEGNMVPVTTDVQQFVDTMVTTRNVQFDAMLPTDVWLDPTGRGRYFIRRIKRTIGDLRRLSQPQTDPNTGQVVIPAVYDSVAVAKLVPASTDPEREAQSALITRGTPYITPDAAIDLYEFWGDFFDPMTGAVLFRNCLITFANKNILIRKPQSNPYRHGELPMVVFSPGLSPFQVYGFGILAPVSQLHQEIQKQWNVILDKARLQVPAVQFFPGSLKSGSQDTTPDMVKFFPGRIFRGRDPDKPIFKPVEGFPPPNPEDFTLLEKSMNLYAQHTNVNEFATGTQQTTNRKTKGEVEMRVSATTQVFNDAAVYMEESAIGPLLKQTYLLMLQYENQYDDQNLARMFDLNDQNLQIVQQLVSMTPEQRWQALYLDAEFRANAISIAVTRQEKLTRLTSFMQLMQGDPAMSVILNRRKFLADALTIFDLDRDYVLDIADAVLQAEQQGMLQQMMGPQQAQGQNQYNSAEQAHSNVQQEGDGTQGEPNQGGT